MSSHPTRRVRVEHIPFGRLKVDHEVQRQLVRARVRYLAQEWDLAKCGTLMVSQRPDGFYIVDGQHRWAAALARGLGETKARCEVHQLLGIKHEAALFLSEQNVRPVHAIDKFRIGLKADEADKIAVAGILAKRSLRVGPDNAKDDVVSCPTELLRLYDKDNDLLGLTLDLILDAWGTRPGAKEGLVIGGVGIFLAKYNGEVDRGMLVKKLAKYRGGPGALIGDAKGYASIKPSLSARRAVAELVRDTYNKGRREASQLPPL